jgi:hypothetical protein
VIVGGSAAIAAARLGRFGSVSEPERKPNPEAIAWYVKRAEDLLDDLRERVQSLRTRGGQLAGFGAAVVALIGGNADRILGALCGTPREIAGIALLLGGGLLIASLATSILGAPFRPQLVSDISAREIANYTTERFTHEPDLWRVHIRTINGLLVSIDSTTRLGDKAAKALRWASGLFLLGLVAVGVALGILIYEVAF